MIHTFIEEEMQTVIFKMHHDEEYDTTNVIHKSVVAEITSIELDYIAQLKLIIQNVVWHKSEIFKLRMSAFSASQESVTVIVLQTQAAEKEAELKFINIDSSLLSNVQMLQASVQRINCSLVLTLTQTFLEHKALSEKHHITLNDVI